MATKQLYPGNASSDQGGGSSKDFHDEEVNRKSGGRKRIRTSASLAYSTDKGARKFSA
ncbi:hypothetical protein [Pseudochryseolinea flava]|uniref:hypothetical protein n=1 Tax=Pseudochryseolinea flava TaxID=2059302 RepID=UPI001403CD7C|nr:hypothetical protein [Pseudochryseolinea flava]